MVALYGVDSEPPEAAQDLAKNQAAQTIWSEAIAALDYAVPRFTSMKNDIDVLKARGHWSGRLDPMVKTWQKDTENLLSLVSSVIENSPSAQTFLDQALAAARGTASIIQGAWQEITNYLKPTPTLSELGFLQMLLLNPETWIAIGALLARLAPYVMAIIIAGQISGITDDLANMLGKSTKRVIAEGENLDRCIRGLLEAKTLEERAAIERACEGAKSADHNYLGWLVLGGLALGAGYLYLKKPFRFAVQSPLAGLSGRRRRRS